MHKGSLALVGATVIDGNGGLPLPDSVVVVTDNRITAVGPSSTTPVPPDAKRVDIKGKFVLPGLIDAHVHVGTSGGGTAYPEEFTAQTFADNLRTYLIFGVTSIMDMAANPVLERQQEQLAKGELLGPRLFGVKYSITAPNSHPIGIFERFHILERMRPVTAQVDTPEAAREAVRKVAGDRTAGVKIYHSRSEFPGNMCLDCDKEKMRPEVLAAVIDEAHKCGLRVYAHVAWPSEAREVIEAGVDVLAHPITHAESGADEVIALMAERGVKMHSTIVRIEAYYGLKVDPFMLDTLRGRVSDVVLDSITRPRSVARMRHTAAGVTGDARRIMEVTMANVRRAVKAGVTVVMGTDAGGPGGMHGVSVPREMELLNLAGLTPMQAIVAATKSAAEVIGQGASIGTIEPGKLADLIVLDDDPVRDISNIRKISAVMRDGELMETASLLFPREAIE
jgi:imidazolonepropionase-like amidohydrolase